MPCRRARAPLSWGMKPGEEGGAKGDEWLTRSYFWHSGRERVFN